MLLDQERVNIYEYLVIVLGLLVFGEWFMYAHWKTETIVKLDSVDKVCIDLHVEQNKTKKLNNQMIQ